MSQEPEAEPSTLYEENPYKVKMATKTFMRKREQYCEDLIIAFLKRFGRNDLIVMFEKYGIQHVINELEENELEAKIYPLISYIYRNRFKVKNTPKITSTKFLDLIQYLPLMTIQIYKTISSNLFLYENNEIQFMSTVVNDPQEIGDEVKFYELFLPLLIK